MTYDQVRLSHEISLLPIPWKPAGIAQYNSPMPHRDEYLTQIARLLEDLRAKTVRPEALVVVNELLAPLIMARATQLCPGKMKSGKTQPLAATIGQALATNEQVDPDAGVIASDAWLYWLGDDGRRLINMARSATDVDHFLNGVLLKVKRTRGDLLRRRVREKKLQNEIQVIFPTDEEPDVLVLDAEDHESVNALLGFLEQTRLGGAPLLCFRYRNVRRPPPRLSDPEISFLEQQRQLNAGEFLMRTWNEHPVPVEELAEALGYANRNTVDQHVNRAQRHIQNHLEEVQDLLGESR